MDFILWKERSGILATGKSRTSTPEQPHKNLFAKTTTKAEDLDPLPETSSDSSTPLGWIFCPKTLPKYAHLPIFRRALALLHHVGHPHQDPAISCVCTSAAPCKLLQPEMETEVLLPHSRKITELFLIRGLISFEQSKLLLLSSHGCKDKTLHKARATSCLTELAALKIMELPLKECSPLLPLKKLTINLGLATSQFYNITELHVCSFCLVLARHWKDQE